MADTFRRELYFPTALYITRLDDADQINSHLLKEIRSERKRDEEGIVRSNIKALGGWHSQNDLMRRPSYKDVTARIQNAANNVAKDCGYDPARKMKIGSMWSIINGPGSFNRSHIHPDCLWSGVYYVQAPKNSGDIEFTEPRTQNMIRTARHKQGEKRPRHCWQKVRFTPEAGKMIIFPAWLYHSVDPNMSEAEGQDAERVIISFNILQT